MVVVYSLILLKVYFFLNEEFVTHVSRCLNLIVELFDLMYLLSRCARAPCFRHSWAIKVLSLGVVYDAAESDVEVVGYAHPRCELH